MDQRNYLLTGFLDYTLYGVELIQEGELSFVRGAGCFRVSYLGICRELTDHNLKIFIKPLIR